MGKTRMVTRTVVSTVASLMVVNLETAEVQNESVELSGTFKNNDAILKALEKDKTILGNSIKPVQVLESKPKETIYGMSEQEFISCAKPMDEKRHIIED